MLPYERTPSAGLPVSTAEITEAGRLAGELVTEAQPYAAAAALEVADYAGLAFLTETIRVIAPGPFRAGSTLRLPVGPVQAEPDATVTMQEFDGTETELDGALWRLIPGRWPELRLLDADLPAALVDARTRLLIDYPAGFGATEASVPDDLKQAVLAQMVRTFDRRGDDDFTRGSVSISAHTARIVARYRGVTV